MLTHHAQQRLATRFGPAEAAVLAARAEREAARYPQGSTAVKLARVPMRGEAWGDASNGDIVLAIVHDGRVVTVEYRRSTQPINRGSMRCDRLAIADEY